MEDCQSANENCPRSMSDESNHLRPEPKLLALHTHALKLSSSTSIEEIIGYTLDAMEFSLGFDYADITVAEEDYLCSHGSRGEVRDFERLPLDGRGITVAAAKTKQTVMVVDTGNEPSYVDRKGLNWAGPPSMRSELAVPVILENEVWGVLNVEDAHVNAFTNDDRVLLELLASHVASTIKRLEQNEALMTQARVLENMLEGVNIVDEKGIIFYTNPAFDEMFGYEKGELIGKHVSVLSSFSLEETELFANDISEALKTRGAWRGEIKNRKKSGNEFYSSMSVIALSLPEKECLISVQEDVTERKRTEEDLRQRLRELKALQETVGDLIQKQDLNELLQRIVERAARLLAAPSAAMYLREPDKEELRLVTGYNTTAEVVGTVLKFGEGVAGVVAITGKPLIVDDYRVWPGRALAFEKQQPFISVVCVPMIWRGQLIGVLDALDNQQPGRFTRADQGLLSMLANHATLAIESVRGDNR